MKTILFILLLICTPVMADVYVITDKTDAVYSISERNDAVIPSGYTETVIKNKMIGDLPIDGDVSLYKFKGNKFSLDGKKVADKTKRETDQALEVESRKVARQSAIEKLKAIGLSESEISALIGR